MRKLEGRSIAEYLTGTQGRGLLNWSLGGSIYMGLVINMLLQTERSAEYCEWQSDGLCTEVMEWKPLQ
jgi:hypothetical protein